MKLTPVNEHVLVQLDEAPSVSKGGIHIPDVAKDKPKRGKVLAVGVNDKPSVKVGDSVLFGHYVAKTEFEGENRETLLLIKETDILAVVE